jgi:hypothetical protein
LFLAIILGKVFARPVPVIKIIGKQILSMCMKIVLFGIACKNHKPGQKFPSSLAVAFPAEAGIFEWCKISAFAEKESFFSWGPMKYR